MSQPLLIEDAHQGVTTPAAQRTIDRYRAFVQERRAPVADMDYSPFTRAPTQTPQQQQPQQPQQQAQSYPKPSLSEEVVPASASDGSLDLGPLALTKPGGASWTVLDFAGLKGAQSKRPSLSSSKSFSSSAAASRKASLTDAQKLWQGESARGGRTHMSFEAAQQIRWAHTAGSAAGSARSSLSRAAHEGPDSGGGKEGGLLGESDWSLSEKRTSLSGKRSSLSDKRMSLSGKQPYLRAHATEERLGVSKPLGPAHRATSQRGLGLGLHASKRASMPPLQNQRGLLPGAGASRRGSLSSSLRPLSSSLGALRARSQSLPSDALFQAYSQCSLPAVMTSSLAAMPIPTQPAIPVTVARRYSVLGASGSLGGAGEHDSVVAAEAADASVAAASEPAVHVDPAAVEGIDTTSVLDTTQLEDLPAEDSDDEPLVQPVQPARRGSVSRAAMLIESESRQSSPASSPVEGPNGPGTVPPFPLTAQHPLAGAAHGQHTGSGVLQGTAARSRSLIQTSLSQSGLSVQAPTRDQQPSGTPDFTPMTSPTNLSNHVFKATLMHRRMSEVVARDVSKKLALLKKYRAQQQDEEEEASPEEGDAEPEATVQAQRMQ